MITTPDKLSLEQKVDMIFTFLFDNSKALEEEFFWNQLTPEEIKKIAEIQQEETVSFESLKSSL